MIIQPVIIHKEVKVKKGEETPREGVMGAGAEFSLKLLGFMPCCFFAVLNLSFPGDRTSVRLFKLALFRELCKALLHLCLFSSGGI